METRKNTNQMNHVNISADGFDPDSLSQHEIARDKKNPSKKDTEKDEKSSFVKMMKDKRTHYLFGIILLLIAVYALIVSISYFSSGDNDQAQILNNTLTELSKKDGAVDNSGGPVGALLSHALIAKGFGLGAFVLIFYIAAIGITLVKFYRFKFWPLTFKSLAISITVSVVSGLLTYNSDSYFYLGGEHGHYINTLLLNYTGIWGAIGVSIALVSLVALIFLNEIKNIYTKSRQAIEARRERIRKESGDNPESNSEETPSANIESSGPTLVDFTEKEDEDMELDEEDIIIDDNSDSEIISNDLNNDPLLIVDKPEIEEASEINEDVYDPTAELSRYRFPSIDLLEDRKGSGYSVDHKEQEENKERITKTLNDYGIAISQIKATVGPTVTLYEIIPAEGVRIAKIKRLEDDIALSLAALGIRIIAPIPGKGTIGIEVPNKEPQIVSMRSIIASKKYQESKADLPMAVGVTISNEVFIADLAKMPHLLVAGATGMGKSVGLNAIIASLLYKKHPAELKFVLIDPKMVEFSLYSKLERHFLAKLPDEDDAIITDPSKVVATLNSLCLEMDNRYSLLRDANVRSLKEYNAKFANRRLNPEKGHRYLPYIVVIVDEFADLIMTAGKEVETPIARIAQKARAVGMHMIIATQRPSTNVITGIIKANFPGRVAFRVNQLVDSRTILDRTGANQLIGKGDMLFSRDGDMDRVQCAFISTEEVVAICDCIDEQIGYDHAYDLPEYVPEAAEGGGMGNVTDRDPLFEDAARSIINSQTASTSSLQRAYKIGYNRAGRIMDQMEAAGIVGPAQGGKPRQVLVDSLQLERILEMR
ncbi:MAG: DNA translocase FtsK 4TM domain-containing protein [Muribaculaceae bacterium]|nr:DNA translocase FtsK 4TM domain-containing protein [Muribaculaceae bacterium]